MPQPDPLSFIRDQVDRLERELSAWRTVLQALTPPTPTLASAYLQEMRTSFPVPPRPERPGPRGKATPVRATAVTPSGKRIRKRFPAGTSPDAIAAWRKHVQAGPAKPAAAPTRKPGRPRTATPAAATPKRKRGRPRKVTAPLPIFAEPAADQGAED